MAWGLVAAGVSAIGGLFGASAQKSQQDQARELQQKAIDRQFKYDKQNYQFNWKETRANYKHLKDGIKLQRDNEERLASYRDATNLQDYNYRLKIQDFEYNQQMRMYNKSESLYRQQRSFNSQAAALAYQSENRRLQETFQEAAFNNQDLLVQLLQEEGQAAARGQAGRSASKGIQSVIASYGRNQAVLAESLVSAERQSSANLRDIDLAKYGADLSAEANRMLRPEQLPAIPVPIAAPRAVFQNPRKPKKPPKPIKMVNTTRGGSSMPVWNAAISGIAGMAGAYAEYKTP
jgi:hypothetical protein